MEELQLRSYGLEIESSGNYNVIGQGFLKLEQNTTLDYLIYFNNSYKNKSSNKTKKILSCFIVFKIVFKKNIGGHKSFSWGHYFGLLVTSTLGFKARVDSFLHVFSPV